MMSVPAETYSFGFNMIFVVWAMVLSVPVLIYIIVPVFYDNNVSNCYEVSKGYITFLETRFFNCKPV